MPRSSAQIILTTPSTLALSLKIRCSVIVRTCPKRNCIALSSASPVNCTSHNLRVTQTYCISNACLTALLDCTFGTSSETTLYCICNQLYVLIYDCVSNCCYGATLGGTSKASADIKSKLLSETTLASTSFNATYICLLSITFKM